MTHEVPQSENRESDNRVISIFDEVQAHHRSDPFNDEGGRFGAVHFDHSQEVEIGGRVLEFWEERIEERDRRDVQDAVLGAHRKVGINVDVSRNPHRNS